MAQQARLGVADVARASVLAYNEKNWERVRASVADDCLYDEVGTNRKTRGVDDTIALWQGWAKAMPDSNATFDNQHLAGNIVVLELTWRGTHTGPLQTPRGQISPTGKKFELRACQIVEVSGERASMIRHYFDMNSLYQQLGVQP
ncbi:MAG: ester cyclase [Vicinamibacterales bacterium]